MTTNVTPPTFTPTGLVVPTAADVLTGVFADYTDAFGGNLSQGLTTPQGQLASSTADIIVDNDAVFAEFVNQVDPDTATEFMQDAIARIYFLERTPGAPTVVVCTLSGADGTAIPVGAQAVDTSGNRYVSTGTGTIASGTLTLSFANIVDGPIACPTGTLTGIYQGITGWDSITNPADGVAGRLVESQADFAFRRQQSVAVNGHGSVQSIAGAVWGVPDVLDVYATENPTNGTVNTGATNYPLAPHSLYVAAVGGTDQAVGTAIWSKKDVGCNYNGNTSVTVTDSTGYATPYPTYTVTFERPTPVAIKFQVNIANVPGLPATIVADTQAAIVAAFTGADGSARQRIGSTVLASVFYAPVIRATPTAPVISILIGTVTANQTSVLMGIDQAPTVSASDINVTLI